MDRRKIGAENYAAGNAQREAILPVAVNEAVKRRLSISGEKKKKKEKWDIGG